MMRRNEDGKFYTEAEAAKIVEAAYKNGMIFYCGKRMMYNDRDLKPGDHTSLVGGAWDIKLIMQGYLIPPDVWDRQIRIQKRKNYESMLESIKFKKAQAVQELKAAEADLVSAKERIANAKAKVELIENEIREKEEQAPAVVQ